MVGLATSLLVVLVLAGGTGLRSTISATACIANAPSRTPQSRRRQSDYQWFDPAPFVAAGRFGTLPRNALVGPAFNNTDVTVIKEMRPGGLRLQFRADVFDVFNHPNFASPGNIVGSPAFGRITRTRLPTGEAGSSRQIQLSLRLAF